MGSDNYTGVTISDSVLKASSQLITGLGSGENLTGSASRGSKKSINIRDGNHCQPDGKAKTMQSLQSWTILVSLVKQKVFKKKSLIYATKVVGKGQIL